MMNFDASSIPPSLIPECDARLDEPAPSRGEEMLRNLIDSGADDFWTTGGARTPAASRDRLEDSRRRRSSGLTRRCRDYAIAATVLLVFSPLMLAIALLIRVDSPGPVLFRQRRLGLRGRPFWVLKYRTMVADAEARLKDLEHLNESDGGVLFKIRRDPRVTRVGRFLRRSSLDELPQLINILRGEMSVVGPRPLQLRDCVLLEGISPEKARRRLEVLPGLTGPWQVNGRSDVGFERMLELDLDYIDRGSTWTDVRILSRTLKVVLLGRGAC